MSFNYFRYTGKSDYKIQFGELGSKPTDLFPKNMTKKPFIDDVLRMGTT